MANTCARTAVGRGRGGGCEVVAHGFGVAARHHCQPDLAVQRSAQRALRNMRIHGLAADTSPPLQLICTLRNTRSGCGISAVKRPSAVVTAVRPSGLPFGLNG